MKAVYFDCTGGFSAGSALAALIGAGVDAGVVQQALARFAATRCQIAVHYTVDNHVTLKFSGFEDRSYPAEEINRMVLNSGLYPGTMTTITELLQKFFLQESMVSAAVLVKMFGVLYGLENLGAGKVYTSPLPVGHSYRRGGKILPAAETLELLKGYPVIITRLPEPLITPCGAALINTLAYPLEDLSLMHLEKTGYGMMEYPVRALVGTVRDNLSGIREMTEHVVVAETAIDDMNPEFYPYVMERLLEAGALDVYLKPVVMKKGRSGIILTVISYRERLDRLLEVVFAETTTLGVRVRTEQRVCLKRDFIAVETPFGPVKVKLAYLNVQDSPLRFAPEFDDCKARAKERGVPVQVVYRAALVAAEKFTSSDGS
ncbi:LarC family nickel insertion protein [Desulfofundulus thermosubterraneus]|uniref:LarC family nickel insertion protein n=1 Tax=Desulfofundulus thermosubterraneus DSM 16057 TaxID=1121432 RepID=A0A1M6EB07_9FIRM|nr:LarC family nickel insertion protein [Desulfofundulus thermosubterraneus]SHI82468.1 hypothetical protein SAMN02745219_01167 [Desulfofundulus thermosubterraneus DSM 16057]